jgi:hypothetical protein
LWSLKSFGKDRNMSEKVKEELTKTLAYYYDIKLNTKYLIYFNKQHQTNPLSQTQMQSQSQSANGNETIMMIITDGIDCWSSCINDEKFLNSIIKIQLNEKVSYIEFVSHLISSLNNEKFELNQILSNDNENEDKSDLIEFKFTVNNSINKGHSVLKCVLLLEPILSAKSKANEIKNFLFFVYQKFTKAELEVKMIKNNISSGTNDANNASSTTTGKFWQFNFCFININSS